MLGPSDPRFSEYCQSKRGHLFDICLVETRKGNIGPIKSGCQHLPRKLRWHRRSFPIALQDLTLSQMSDGRNLDECISIDRCRDDTVVANDLEDHVRRSVSAVVGKCLLDRVLEGKRHHKVITGTERNSSSSSSMLLLLHWNSIAQRFCRYNLHKLVLDPSRAVKWSRSLRRSCCIPYRCIRM